jgi:Protein of unknown function with HXXEE motif
MLITLDIFSQPWLVIWLALFPLTYLAHIAEEYWGGGGYSEYLLRTYNVELPHQRFLILQALGMSLMLLGVTLGMILRFPLTMVAILSAIILGNALVHTVRSIYDRMYAPGLITAIGLWVPLGIISLKTVWPITSTARLVLALLVGFAANWIVELISFRDTQVGQKEPQTSQ